MRKVTRMYDNTALLCSPTQVDIIKSSVIDGNNELPEFTEIFDRNYFIKCNEHEMIEKCVILTHLFSRDFNLFLESTPNLLAELMWHGQFKSSNFD
jgi:hypothetical protein